MNLFLVLLLAVAEPEFGPPSESPRACVELDAKLNERVRVEHAAQRDRDRAAVRYYDAVEAKGLPKKPTPAQQKAVADEVLAAWAAKEEAESRLRLTQESRQAMESYVTRERSRLGCRRSVPRG